MSQTGISDIKDYNSLYRAYSRLKNEGDHTTSAKNAKAIFGQDIDIDKDNTAELWEFMQAANKAQHKIIFNEINQMKEVQNNKYPQISDDNPINIILSKESQTVGKRKTAKAYAVINDIIRVAKEKITDKMSPFEKLQKLYGIIRDDFDIPYGSGTYTLSEGLAQKIKRVNCDKGSYIFIAVAHELGWPVYFMCPTDTASKSYSTGHAFIFWEISKNKCFGFETTTGKRLDPEYCSLLEQEAGSIIKIDKNYIMADAYNNHGIENYLGGYYNLAIEDYNRALQLRPGWAEVYFNLGSAHYQLSKYNLVINDLNKALKLGLDWADVHYNLGSAYNQLNEYSLAIKAYARAVEIKPDLAKARNFDLVINQLNKAIKLKPNCAEAYYDLGGIYNVLGKNDKAIENYDKALKLRPDWAEARIHRGDSYYNLGRYNRAVYNLAIEDYTRVIKLMPDSIETYDKRAATYDKLGEHKLAEKDREVMRKLWLQKSGLLKLLDQTH